MSKEIEIKTVQDMIDCTNNENLDRFLEDLKATIQAAHGLRYIAKVKCEKFTWIDDHEKKVEIKIGAK